MKQNFLKAAIFYEDLSQEIINEIPVYTVSIIYLFLMKHWVCLIK